ncbi:mannose-6-phosphate isomerase [Aureococcus anophagefferens]|uniref:Mannose-6-phosphate isomerase n=1 Tax=Aureococcus anophagefferens TaxID=44056 RepID=A0ABR1GEB8_AURAN
MAIALHAFEAMCGFRRLSEIAVHLRKHPEFAACISTEAQLGVFMASSLDVGGQKRALHGLFEVAFMARRRGDAPAQLEKLVGRLRQQQSCAFRTSGANHINPALSDATPGVPGGPDAAPSTESAWERKARRAILRLEEQFPGDVGAMAPLFLNYLLIAPGESFFMAANEPRGSRRVSGLTPKHKDVENLVDMLSYTMGGPDIEFGRLVHVGEGTRTLCYTRPRAEFEVLITTRKHQYERARARRAHATAGTIALNLATSDGCKGPLKVARARSNLTMLGKSEDA